MASNTSRLNLLKKNPVTDGADTFNIETMLNENWDKIDKGAALIDPATGKLLPGQENAVEVDVSGLATKQELQVVDGKVAAHLADLASQELGKGASLIGIHDAGNLFASTTVEGALKEVFQFGNSKKVEIVDALLSIDPSLPITHGSSWTEIETAIQNFSIGGMDLPVGTSVGERVRTITAVDKNGNIYCTERPVSAYVGKVYDKNMTLLQTYESTTVEPILGVSDFGYIQRNPGDTVSIYDTNKTLLVSSLLTVARPSIGTLRDGQMAYELGSTNGIARIINFSGTILYEKSFVGANYNTVPLLNKKNNFIFIHAYISQVMAVYRFSEDNVINEIKNLNGTVAQPFAFEFINW